MRPLLCASALLAGALLSGACKKEPNLVGKWTGTVTAPTGQSQAAQLEFTADNKLTIGFKQGTIELNLTGDYKRESEKLTMTLKEVSLKGLPPGLKGTEDMAKKTVESMLNKPQTNTLTFTSDDQVSLSPATTADKKGSPLAASGGAITLTRVKDGA